MPLFKNEKCKTTFWRRVLDGFAMASYFSSLITIALSVALFFGMPVFTEAIHLFAAIAVSSTAIVWFVVHRM